LERRTVTYTATVLDKTGAPAVGVAVSWTDGRTIVGTAVTGADGKATCDIAYGDYTVTLGNLPDGNLLNDDLTATGTNPDVTTQLINGVAETYTVTVKSEGGLLFKKQAVMVYRNGRIFTSGITDDEGVYSFSASDATYTVSVEAMPTEGYTAQNATLSASNRTGEIVLHSEVLKTEPTARTHYVIGDIIHDYSFTTPYDIDGAPKTYKMSELLKTKDAVIINNWGTQCSNCMLEMAAMNEAFETYKDSIQIIAASNYRPADSDQVIINYHEQHADYNIPMMVDRNGLSDKFELTGWPTTVVIDRYGAIARIEVGAVFEAEAWGRMIEKYIGDDYV
ncbi:MAG: redoxin domain-containing protein, partial [Clostridia bacterium]|nr:redoxin domain-containing protein [Clostridia bacterium]